ncbi:MAG: DUF362 domain-containing protein [Deltaproteobacteria bacterium]|nr:DUF362 domain-containing protein [Deltaproteobacteria bacterium]MBW2678021.1 DUF362 domain-containing protein [Deltaproteobacteria bacterium]
MILKKLNRREFLGTSAALACTAMLPSVVTAGEAMPSPSKSLPYLKEYRPGVNSAWIRKGRLEKSSGLIDAVLDATTDFSWLSKGDRILIKLALNSGNEYPATTDPWALAQVVRILKNKGAGEVLVGDQSGIQAVQWNRDSQRGSSRELCRSAGLLQTIEASGATPVFFEEAGYDAYIQTSPPGNHHWETPLWIPSIVNQVDHIIFMPRVSSHVMGELTSGMKLGVGFLREDSRRVFHSGGENFFAMYEEIAQVPEISSRLRLTITSGRKVLTTIGPDFGDMTEPEYGLVFASEDLLANEIFSYAWLLWNREFETSYLAKVTKGNVSRFGSFINKKFVGKYWPEDDADVEGFSVFRPGHIYDHPAIMNCMQRKGGKPMGIDWKSINEIDDHTVSTYLKQHMTA